MKTAPRCVVVVPASPHEQSPPPEGGGDADPGIFALPAIKGLLTDPHFAAHLADRGTVLRLPQCGDDLLLGKLALARPAPPWITLELTYHGGPRFGGQVMFYLHQSGSTPLYSHRRTLSKSATNKKSSPLSSIGNIEFQPCQGRIHARRPALPGTVGELVGRRVTAPAALAQRGRIRGSDSSINQIFLVNNL